MTAQALLAAAMTEDDLQTNVMDLCRVYGLLVYHTHDSRRSPAGFPDLVIVGRRLLIRELKTVAGKVTVDQQRWLAVLATAGVDAGVWRPEQWLDGTIRAELAAVA